METKTHPDFKSLQPNIENAKTIYNYLSNIYKFQNIFHKKTTPCEKRYWKHRAIDNFKINVQNIDRLYYLKRYKIDRLYYLERYKNNNDSDSDNDSTNKIIIYKMIARLDHNKKPIYVEMTAYSCFCCRNGDIFISSNVNLFMKLVLTQNRNINRHLIYNSLKRDGIYMDWKIIDDYIDNNDDKIVPMLEYLCQETMCKNKDYEFLLPGILIDNFNDFIITRKARLSYKEFIDKRKKEMMYAYKFLCSC